MSEMKLSGYAVTYDPYPVYGGPGSDNDGWMETVDREALEHAVNETPRLPLRVGNRVVGEAALSVDDTGLKVDATLDVGYRFRAKDQEWDAGATVRRILSISLEEFSVTEKRTTDWMDKVNQESLGAVKDLRAGIGEDE